jgi:hypothetical protein
VTRRRWLTVEEREIVTALVDARRREVLREMSGKERRRIAPPTIKVPLTEPREEGVAA